MALSSSLPVRIAGLENKASDTTGQQQQDVCCHKLVLSSVSPGYWRLRIKAWLPSAAPHAKAAGDGEAAGSSQTVAASSASPVLEEHCTPEELPACLAVLQHMYTGKLPEGADVELLCTVGGQRPATCIPASQSAQAAGRTRHCTTVLLCFLQLAVKADYWDCAATLSACFTQLRDSLASPVLPKKALAKLIPLLLQPDKVCT